jgi:hypothetical protein
MLIFSEKWTSGGELTGLR